MPARFAAVRLAAMSVDPVEWKIQTLRGQLLELGSAIRQLNQSGLDRAFSSEVETRFA
jgi:hypothetical protein